MGQPFSLTSGNAPFVPHSRALPKKKARELQTLIPELTLSRAQHIVARAFGWTDWFSLGQAINHAITHEYPRSLPDEKLEDVEVIRRFQNQKRVLREENVAAGNDDHVLESLSLTRSPIAVYARKIAGPWGAFDETPEEVFPGVVSGTCGGTPCYYLTPARASEVPLPLRLETAGWYPTDKHEWRIAFTFPRYYTNEQRWRSGKSFAMREPFLYELTTDTPMSFARVFGPSMAIRKKAAQAHPNAWFALCVRRFTAFRKDRSTDTSSADTSTLPAITTDPDYERASRTFAVGAVRGSTLLKLMTSGVWPKDESPESAWFGVDQSEAQALKDGDTRLSGKMGWALPRIAERPFVQSPFSSGELVLGSTTLPTHILAQPSMGASDLIP